MNNEQPKEEVETTFLEEHENTLENIIRKQNACSDRLQRLVDRLQGTKPEGCTGNVEEQLDGFATRINEQTYYILNNLEEFEKFINKLEEYI